MAFVESAELEQPEVDVPDAIVDFFQYGRLSEGTKPGSITVAVSLEVVACDGRKRIAGIRFTHPSLPYCRTLKFKTHSFEQE